MREALWGGPGFDPQNPFYREVAKIAGVRGRRSALRYGRFYFRPLSGDGRNFGVSPYAGGVLAFSRIRNDEEVTVVANTDGFAHSLEVIVDGGLNQLGSLPAVLYGNNPAPRPPGPVTLRTDVVVQEVDGSVGTGPLHVVAVSLQPLEVQVLGRSVSP